MFVHFSAKSSNSKTGPMMVIRQSEDTCAPGCPFNGKGCYGQQGPLYHFVWKKVSAGKLAKSWESVLQAVRNLAPRSLFRMSEVGDLPHKDGEIEEKKLQDLIDASQGKRPICYTHHDVNSEHNRRLIQHANTSGFTINLSANNLKDADKKAALGIAPVAVPIPADPKDWPKTTPEGRPIVVCLHDTKGLTCLECGVCAVASRKAIIGFPAHGSGKRKLEAVLAS